jgi:D-alanyl-D-alanine carboxypeptidase/D-alanyl-D-alanine-endopeptidase (penicillin-binding protein 4)
MQQQIDSLINLPIFETTQLGLYVRDLTDGRDLVCVNHRQRMRPASCQKVITAIGAIRHLGGSYKLHTQMMVTGEVRDSVLWGDVCFIGGMDPILSQGEVYQMTTALKDVGIDSLAGVIYLDLTMKSQDDMGWGWCWDDKTVPLRPLMVDKKDHFVSEILTDLKLQDVKGASIDRVVQAKCPPSARLLCDVTHTIDQVLERMMKRSDNYFAECLFYQLAALSGHRPAGRSEGEGRHFRRLRRGVPHLLARPQRGLYGDAFNFQRAFYRRLRRRLRPAVVFLSDADADARLFRDVCFQKKTHFADRAEACAYPQQHRQDPKWQGSERFRGRLCLASARRLRHTVLCDINGVGARL